ncbi:MAG: arsenate reductase family protein [Spirochaetales bacterium]|nr:arsenate reductase family protein [Spirochaetales bacterium]
MAVQIFGTKKCSRTAKAVRFFKERGIDIHVVDLAEKGISKGELTKVVQSAGLDDLIDSDGKEFKKRGMAYIEFDPFEEALENPLLIRMPIVRNGNRAVLGDVPEKWKEFLPPR